MMQIHAPVVRSRTYGRPSQRHGAPDKSIEPSSGRSRALWTQAEPAQAPLDSSEAPKMEDMVWDPQNLIKGGKLGKGHIEKRLAQRRARQQAEGPRNMVLKLPEDVEGPVFIKDAQEQFSFNGKPFLEHMKEMYLPISEDLHERVQLLNMDPPVLTVENLIPSDLCDRLRDAADASGQLARSRLGGGLSVDESMPVSERRTSSSLLIGTAYSSSPELLELGSQVQSIIKSIFATDRWGPPCTVPKTGSLVLEGLQVAKYEKGEHFLSHEDGFPTKLAEENGFQRQATVLLYLNDVPEGGSTFFDWLGISVRPQKGKALIFFPSFANGLPDDRTLHSAQDAVDRKWVAQQWIAASCKPQKKPSVDPVSAAAGRAALLKAGVGQTKMPPLGAGKKGLLQTKTSNVQSAIVSEETKEQTAAEQKARASMNKKRRTGKPSGKAKKGFGG